MFAMKTKPKQKAKNTDALVLAMRKARQAKFNVMRADLERKEYEKTHPTYHEMLGWTKMGA